MPAAIAFECEVSEMAVAEFTKTMANFQRRTQRDMRDAVRIATVDLCKSLRKQTRKAKQYLPKSAFRFGKSDPQWIHDGKNGTVLRRMIRKGFPNSDRLRQQGDFVFFQKWDQVHTVKRTKRGGVRESWTYVSEAQLIRAAREKYGLIWNWGLAKQSWGWFMWRLFNIRSNADFANPRVRITHNHVDGGITETREPLPDGTIDLQAPIKCEITIINRIRYIRRALAPGALAVAVQQATKSLQYKAKNCVKSSRFD